jgi:hypothetical protein
VTVARVGCVEPVCYCHDDRGWDDPSTYLAGCSACGCHRATDEVPCLYCGAYSSPAPPPEHDDRAWLLLLEIHGSTCEWARTRAHSRHVFDLPDRGARP